MFVYIYIFDVSLAESSFLLLGDHAHNELNDCQMWWKQCEVYYERFDFLPAKAAELLVSGQM